MPFNKFKILIWLFTGIFSTTASAQLIYSGEYNNGLILAYNAKTDVVSGYFEDCTGWNRETQSPQFCCIFYLSGKVNNNRKIPVQTRYPGDEKNSFIEGWIDCTDANKINIQLKEEHGGCGNVLSFSSGQVIISLEKPLNIVEVRYIVSDNCKLYTNSELTEVQPLTLNKNDFVLVRQIVNNLAQCSFLGEKSIDGWLKLSDLNNIE